MCVFKCLCNLCIFNNRVNMGDAWQECMDYCVEVVKQAGQVNLCVFIYILDGSDCLKHSCNFLKVTLGWRYCFNFILSSFKQIC